MPGPHRTTQELMQIFGKGRGQARREELHGHRPFRSRMRSLQSCIQQKIKKTQWLRQSIKPEPIVVTRHNAHHNKLTAQQAATWDLVSQQTHPLRPGDTRVYPSMLADKQVPVLNLTESSITSQADLQDAFQSICLCSHGGKESTEDKYAE